MQQEAMSLSTSLQYARIYIFIMRIIRRDGESLVARIISSPSLQLAE